MSLVINNNMMAANTARILGNTYDSLSKSTQRLSSGLRINSAADDAAGLAIRELMRADIATMRQGIRNAADGISLLQTAEGAMAVIDEKLVRMKELAEQAATGTYTTVQREIINSEYQAMAAEIDRIANATEFNGVKLLDGSMSSIHQGLGLKIHFGTGNNEAEDYYFIQIGDIRATSQSGLRIGGDAKNDIWGTVGTHGGPNTTGCCGGGIPSLNSPVTGWHSGEVFAYGYNWDWTAEYDFKQEFPESGVLNRGRYIAGSYQVGSGATLQELLDAVNRGTQARVRVDFSAGVTLGGLISESTPNTAFSSASVTKDDYGNLRWLDVNGKPTENSAGGTADVNPAFKWENVAKDANGVDRLIYTGVADTDGSAHRICIGDEVYYVGSAALGRQANNEYKNFHSMSAGTITNADGTVSTITENTWAISALALAINSNPNSEFWARVEEHPYRKDYSSLYIFRKEGGASDLSACDEQLGRIRGGGSHYHNQVLWYNDENEYSGSAGTRFNNGGKNWGTLRSVPTGYGSWGVKLEGMDVGDGRDLWILNVGSGAGFDINTASNVGYTGSGFGLSNGVPVNNLLGLDRHSFVQIQDAADGDWDGAHVRTQSHAQEALDAIQAAIEKKDKIRATLGAYQNRLENTITNLEIQAENLQASESRISDVDMATEMTTFVKNQVLTQAAISMLSQANSLPQMALSLLNG